jgi:hypothetical protein
VLAGLPDISGNGRGQVRQQSDAEKDELYKQIDQLKMELDFFKNGRERPNRTPDGPETLGTCTFVVSGGMAVHFLVFCEESKNMVWGWLADLTVVTPSGDPV